MTYMPASVCRGKSARISLTSMFKGVKEGNGNEFPKHYAQEQPPKNTPNNINSSKRHKGTKLMPAPSKIGVRGIIKRDF